MTEKTDQPDFSGKKPDPKLTDSDIERFHKKVQRLLLEMNKVQVAYRILVNDTKK